MTLLGGDQVAAEVFCADVVDIAGDLEGRNGALPVFRILGKGGEAGYGEKDSFHSPYFNLLASIIESGWFDTECPQIDVCLTAMMDLVVNGVQDCADSAVFPLAEGLIDLSETVSGNRRPDGVYFLR